MTARHPRQGEWVSISAGEARQHPLYGLNLILFLFMLLVIGGLLIRIAMLTTAMTFAPILDPADVAFSDMLLAWGIALPVPFLLLSLAWRKVVPAASIACIWGSVALDAGYLQLGIMLPSSLAGMIISTAAAPLLTYYVLLSRRVNVTYRHRVRAGEQALAAPPVAGVA